MRSHGPFRSKLGLVSLACLLVVRRSRGDQQIDVAAGVAELTEDFARVFAEAGRQAAYARG